MRRLLLPLPFLALLLLALACNSDDDGGGGSLDPLAMCVEHGGGLAIHIHAEIIPILEHQPQLLPADIGVTPDCMRPLHTHAADFRVHIESPEPVSWTVRDFFRVWGDDNPYRELGIHNVSLNNERYEGDYNDIVLEDGTSVIIDFALR